MAAYVPLLYLPSVLKRDKESAMRLAQLLSRFWLRDKGQPGLKGTIKAKQESIRALPKEQRIIALQA